MEEFDLYTINRIKTGQIIKRGMKVPKGYYRLVVHICIFNSKGEMLIQRRSDSKKSWPGLWDVSVGGCAIKGEKSIDAIYRETLEEIGVKLDKKNLRPFATFNFVSGFDDFYFVDLDLDPTKLVLQSDEVAEVKYATKEEINQMMKDGSFVKYHDSFMGFIWEIHETKEIYDEYQKKV